MTRTKKGGRKSAGSAQVAPVAPVAPSASTTFSAADLIGKAHTLLAQSNHSLAIRFLDRALEIESDNLEARELLGIAELEGGDPDVGRQHLSLLFPPAAASPPAHPSPYLYMAQSAETPQESLSYFEAAVQILENRISGTVASTDGPEIDKETCVKCLIAMIELWMTDFSEMEEASARCDALIEKALALDPYDIEARLVQASIRLSQERIEEAKGIVEAVYNEVEGKEPFDETLPPLPVRILLVKQLLEHDLTSEALVIVSLIRSEDSLNVEGAYLEGWAWYLRAEAIKAGTIVPDEDEPETAEECYAESMRALLEAAKEHEAQEHEDEGIAAHLAELLDDLETKGVTPAVDEDDDEQAGDVEMKD